MECIGIFIADLTEKMWMISEEEKKGQKTPLCRTPTSELLQLAAQCLITRPPSTEPGSKEEKKSASQELLDLIKGSGWWKINENEMDKGRTACCKNDCRTKQSEAKHA